MSGIKFTYEGDKMSKLNDFLDIPNSFIGKVPQISIVGFEEVLIENYNSILEYENFFVRVNTHIGNININGFNLNLTQINEFDILVKGKISSLDFEREKKDDI